MNSYRRQYLFGGLFIAFAVYQAVVGDMLEFSLYGIAGVAFILNAATFEPRLIAYKKPLVITTWVFIAVTGALFLYLLQFKYF